MGGCGCLAAAVAIAANARAGCSTPLAVLACGLWCAGVWVFWTILRDRIR